MINSCTVFLYLTSIEKKGKVSLIFNTWIPYNINCRTVFFFTYLYQALALLMTAMISIATECFAMLITLQICGQLDIIIHRLNLLSVRQSENCPEFIKHQLESKIIKDCVIHHNYVYA